MAEFSILNSQFSILNLPLLAFTRRYLFIIFNIFNIFSGVLKDEKSEKSENWR